MSGNVRARRNHFGAEEEARASRPLQDRVLEARALESVMSSLALIPGIRNVEFRDDPLGKVIEVTTTNPEAAHAWREDFGRSYAHLRIRIRKSQGD